MPLKMLKNRQQPQAPSPPPTGLSVDFNMATLQQFLPEMGQVIHAAGISSLILTVLFVLFTIVRYVRARMHMGPWWHTDSYAEMTRVHPLSTGIVENRMHGLYHARKNPPKNRAPSTASQSRSRPTPRKNAVFSDSEDSD